MLVKNEAQEHTSYSTLPYSSIEHNLGNPENYGQSYKIARTSTVSQEYHSIRKIVASVLVPNRFETVHDVGIL